MATPMPQRSLVTPAFRCHIRKGAVVTNDRWGIGMGIADYDNDGWPDIYVTNSDENRLYHNNHDGTFTDVAEKEAGRWGIGRGGLRGATMTATGAWICLFRATFISTATICLREARTACRIRSAPSRSRSDLRAKRPKGEPDHLFHNNGDGTFTDVSEKAGVADKPGYSGWPRCSWT